MTELIHLRALLGLLRDRLERAGSRETGGIISEYAVVLAVAVAAIGIIAALVVAIRSRFASFTGGT
jgi:hypothetical protein